MFAFPEKNLSADFTDVAENKKLLVRVSMPPRIMKTLYLRNLLRPAAPMF
jgi:hypothetical protein